MHTAPFDLVLDTATRHRVLALRGVEATSRPFRFDLTLVTDEPEALLGHRATLAFQGEQAALRQVHGLIDAVRSDATERATVVRLVPRLARLQRRRTRRVFQHKTTLHIAAALLAEWELPLVSVVGRELPVRPYSVQYDETDLAYLERLFAEDGLFYGFDHAEDAKAGEALLVADRPSELATIDGPPRLVLRPGGLGEGGRAPEDTVLTLERRCRRVVGRTRVRAYDHRRPLFTLDDASGDDTLETADVDTGSSEDALPARPARLRLEAEAARGVQFTASTYCRRLEPLRRLHLDEAGGEVLVTRVRHEGYSGEQVPGGKPRYQNRVELLPGGLAPRPRRGPPKPRQVSETATVVGPAGAEVHLDEQGRIKVRFHWDRDAKGDDASSCWLRALSPWAGAGWGVQFTPRVGMEVLVTFIGGDVDRPVCAGTLANAIHPPPFGGLLSGIRTQSSPGGGNANELSFDDAAGAERLVVVAARDLDERVGGARTSTVGGGRHAVVTGHDTTEVAGDVCARVGGGRETAISGREQLHVGGAWQTVVEGPRETAVRGGDRLLVGEDRVLEVRGQSTTIVGGPEHPAHREDYVHGSLSVAAQDRVLLRSDTALVLECGTSSIELLPDRIVLRSRAVDVAATERLTCGREDGPTLTLTDEAELLAKAIRVFTDGAALELDADFKTQGKQIQLGYDPSRPPRDSRLAKPETVVLELLLSNDLFEPHAGLPYHLVVDGLRFEGTTTPEGKLSVAIPTTARAATLRLWERDYPTGPQLLYAIHLGEIPGGHSLEGTRARLTNLGYFHGSVDDQPVDDELSEALRDFQADHDDTHALEATGDADAASRDALVDVHGG